MHTLDPNDYIWLEIHRMNQEIERTVQAFASYAEWFFIVAAVVLVCVLAVMLCLNGLGYYTRKPHQLAVRRSASTRFASIGLNGSVSA